MQTIEKESGGHGIQGCKGRGCSGSIPLTENSLD